MVIDFLLDDIREAIADIQEDVSGLTETSFADVDYVASAKTIYFYNVLGEELGTIDTTDFVIDGMVDNVTLSGSILSITFNTDAGKETINIDLNDFINPEYYWASAQTKDYVDSGDTATYAAASAYTDEKIDEVYASSTTFTAEAIAEALAPYWDSAATKEYVDSADTAILVEVGELSGVVQEQQIVFSSGYNELHTQVMELSGRTVDLSGYYTSGETDAAISAATAGKADAASVSANTNTSRWPAWNSQGIITGTVGNIGYEASLTINGTQKWLWGNGSSGSFGKIYAPTNAGTAGQILTPSGNTPVWVTPATINGSAITAGGNIEIQGGGDMSDYWTSAQTKAYVDSADTALQDQLDTMDEVVSAALVDLNDTKVASTDIKHMVKITQADYEDLPVKDPYTFYIIIDNS